MRHQKREIVRLRITGRKPGFYDESQMRDHIAENLDELEYGMLLHNFDDPAVEFPCQLVGEPRPTGNIDILAVDNRGDFVVIECKNERATPSALGQLLGYISWIKEHLPTCGRPVRGMIVAVKASPQLLRAVRFLPHIPIMVFECKGPNIVRRVL